MRSKRRLSLMRAAVGRCICAGPSLRATMDTPRGLGCQELRKKRARDPLMGIRTRGSPCLSGCPCDMGRRCVRFKARQPSVMSRARVSFWFKAIRGCQLAPLVIRCRRFVSAIVSASDHKMLNRLVIRADAWAPSVRVGSLACMFPACRTALRFMPSKSFLFDGFPARCRRPGVVFFALTTGCWLQYDNGQ